MVCSRCIMVVKAELDKLGLQTTSIELGEVEFKEPLDNEQKALLNSNLKPLGFELIEDFKSITVEKVKNLIVDLVQNKGNELKVNLSAYLSKNLGQDYNTISSLFSETENKTIEHFFIQQKIEKVKELLTYNELNLNEIADQMNYSSVGYLSNQFKKVTGLTPTGFKQSGVIKRFKLDKM